MNEPTAPVPLPYCVPCPPQSRRNVVLDVLVGVAIGFSVQYLIAQFVRKK